MGMTISQLLQSTEKVKGYGSSDTFKKKVGKILAYNKVVKAKPKHSVIEITMMIKGMTETVYQARTGRRPVAAHKVMIAISGVEQEIVSGAQLAQLMRDTYDEYKDTEEYSDKELIKRATDETKKPFAGKTVMVQGNDTYVIINDGIKDDSYIQVWCSCSSYYWVFQYYNIEAGVNIIKPGAPVSMPTYRYKTKKGFEAYKKGKPMRNPKKAPGMCKHLMLLLAMLMSSNLISDSSKASKKTKAQYMLNIHNFKKIKRLGPNQYKKLMAQYDKDHDRKVKERKMFSSGLASMAQNQRGLSYGAKIVKKMR